jgi:hypothetical protein
MLTDFTIRRIAFDDLSSTLVRARAISGFENNCPQPGQVRVQEGAGCLYNEMAVCRFVSLSVDDQRPGVDVHH